MSTRINRTNTPARSGAPTPPKPAKIFQEYIDTLPLWKWELLVGISCPDNIDKLAQHLVTGDKLFICSDGGAKKHSGSFGWVIASATDSLWECSGIATGWHANSFRSEGIGQLAALVFLEAFTSYYQLHDLSIPPSTTAVAPWIRIATDNLGLIQHIETGLATKTVFAGVALSPEYDIVNEILEITNRLPIPLSWEHVLGHQDKKRKWYELTWMERLNVRADSLATEGLEGYDDPTTLVTHIPSSKVALRIAMTNITSHYATHLRKAATRPAMLNRVHKQYGWTPSQFDMIDWKAHHGAHKKLITMGKSKFVQKFIHQSLPMGEWYHKVHPSQSKICHSCKRKTESEMHLYRCLAR
jgi:hypothetical protein